MNFGRTLLFIFYFTVIMTGVSHGTSDLIFLHDNSTDKLTASVCDWSGYPVSCRSINLSSPQAPDVTSYVLPYVSWMPEINAWRIVGANEDKSLWSGVIWISADQDVVFRLMSGVPGSAKNRILPPGREPFTLIVTEELPGGCASWSYGDWENCMNGQQTRAAAGNPAGCTGSPDQPIWRACTQCSGYDYSSWGTCGNNTQTRTVIGYTPAGCSGSPTSQPSLSQTCTSCTDFTYSSWGACTNGSQSRSVTGYLPLGCSGTPSAAAVVTQMCTCCMPCTGYTYSSWGACTNGIQSRTITSYTPVGCIGTPGTAAVLTQSCTSPAQCTDYIYSSWGACRNGAQTRTATGYIPVGCSIPPVFSPVVSQSCTYAAEVSLGEKYPNVIEDSISDNGENFNFELSIGMRFPPW